jgi:hypothetical protein
MRRILHQIAEDFGSLGGAYAADPSVVDELVQKTG